LKDISFNFKLNQEVMNFETKHENTILSNE